VEWCVSAEDILARAAWQQHLCRGQSEGLHRRHRPRDRDSEAFTAIDLMVTCSTGVHRGHDRLTLAARPCLPFKSWLSHAADVKDLAYDVLRSIAVSYEPKRRTSGRKNVAGLWKSSPGFLTRHGFHRPATRPVYAFRTDPRNIKKVRQIEIRQKARDRHAAGQPTASSKVVG